MFSPLERLRRRSGSRRRSATSTAVPGSPVAKRPLGGLAAILLVLAALVITALPAAPAGAIEQTAPFLGGYGSTCFWHYGPFGGPESEQPTYNLAYPNGHAIYFGAYFRRPAGSKLVLHGQYPHSRNFNFVTYTPNSIILDGIYDEQINPDAGSINPFRAGENRNATNRGFSVEVLPTVNPNSALPRTATHFEFEEHRNYIYAASSPAIEETTKAGKKYVNELVMERIYLPDKGDGIDGGVPVPEAELTLENGEKLTGQAACDALDSESKTLTEEGGKTENGKFELVRFGEVPEFLPQKVWFDMNHPEATPAPGCNVLVSINFGKNECPLWNGKNPVSSPKTELIQVPRAVEYPEEFPAKPTENWRTQYNRRYLLQLWTGDTAPGAEKEPKRGNDGGGFFPNPDNNYVRQVFSRKFGKLVVLKGKMPKTPETSKSHLAIMPDMHNYQLRFYDMCSLSAMTVSQVLTCKDDEETTLQDAERHYTLVYSRAEDKPRNAVRFCGNSWLEWSAEGDANPGEPNREFGYLTMRMLLPNPEFKNAVQYSTKPGTEREVMGEYLPTWKYEAEKSVFETGGCAFANPGVPQLKNGSASPNTGAFTLEWAPSKEAGNAEGVTYTLQHESASGGWETVAAGLTSPEYSFSGGSPEAEGTWTYRVLASGEGAESEYSAASAPVKVDRSGPNEPSAHVSRAPDYAGGGGWYENEVEVSFSANGDRTLPDGSAGSGVDEASLSAPVSFSTDGSHEACGAVADVLGNVSTPGCVTVQVDATAPSLEVNCPAMVAIGATGVNATVTASDGQSGLASDPSGSVAINTSKAGDQTVTRTAVDNVGHETTRSCTTFVGYYVVVKGPISGLIVRAGEAVLLSSSASVSGLVTVKPGGALDIEGAKLAGKLASKGAALLRICGSSIAGGAKVSGGTGPVVIGEGTAECAADTIGAGVTVIGNKAGVSVVGNVLGSSLKVTGNSGGATVTTNKVAGSLTVLANTGTVLDTPNEVKGKSKLQ